MLVLQRRTGQSIQIGEQIKIKFLRQSNGYIQIGIVAPKDILILRSEIIGKPPKKKSNSVSISLPTISKTIEGNNTF